MRYLFHENRVIRRTLADFGLTSDQKVTTRNAKAIVAEQQRQSAQTMLTPGSRIYIQPGVNAPVDYDLGELQRKAGYNPKTGVYNPISTIYNTTKTTTPPTSDQGNIAKLRALRLSGREGGVDAGGNVIDKGAGTYAGTGGAAPVATEGQRAANIANLKGIADVGFNVDPVERRKALRLEKRLEELRQPLTKKQGAGIIESDWEFAIRQGAQQQEITAIEEQLSELQKRSQARSKEDAAMVAGQEAANQGQPTPTPETQGGQQGMSKTEELLADILKNNPEMAKAYLPQLESILNAEGTAGDIYGLELQEAGTVDEGAYQDRRDMARQDYMDKLDFNEEKDQLARDRAEETKRSSLAANERAEALSSAELAKDELEQIRKNTNDELQARRGINRLGGGHDYSGLHYVREQVQSGLDALSFIRTKAAIMHGSYGDKAVDIINKYALDMRQSDADAMQWYDDAYDAYRKELGDISKDYNADKKEVRKMRFEAHKNYSKTLTDLDLKKGELFRDMKLKAIERADKLEKDFRDSQKQIFDQAFKYIDTYGTSNKRQLMLYEQQLNLPPGSLSNQRTIEELRLYKTSGGGGLTGQNVADYVNDKRELFMRQYPDKTGEQIDQMVISMATFEYSSGKNADKTVAAMADYMTRNNLERHRDVFFGSMYGGEDTSDFTNKPYAIVPKKSPFVQINQGGLTDEEKQSLGLE